MKRTVWIAFGFLIIVCTLVTLKARIVPPAKQQAAFSDDVLDAYASQEASPKADRPDVNNVENVPDKKTVQTTTIVLSKRATDDAATNPPAKISKIISRHWHEGYAKMTKRSVLDRHTTPKHPS
jgi:hypothetical protein